MPSHRNQRMAQAIREVVATAILFEIADPRVCSVTVLRVDVSGDLRHATVFVSIMGTPTEQRRAFEGLKHATGFLQARVAARLQTRFTPVLTFKLDESIKKSAELARLLDEAMADQGSTAARESKASEAPAAEPVAARSNGHPAPGDGPESP
jgi:ribosome-binding factor A